VPIRQEPSTALGAFQRRLLARVGKRPKALIATSAQDCHSLLLICCAMHGISRAGALAYQAGITRTHVRGRKAWQKALGLQTCSQPDEGEILMAVGCFLGRMSPLRQYTWGLEDMINARIQRRAVKADVRRRMSPPHRQSVGPGFQKRLGIHVVIHPRKRRKSVAVTGGGWCRHRRRTKTAGSAATSSPVGAGGASWNAT